jgi:hypothetical protein
MAVELTLLGAAFEWRLMDGERQMGMHRMAAAHAPHRFTAWLRR